MKLIILDYFRRRGLLLAIIFIAYFIIEAWSVAGGGGQSNSEIGVVAAVESIHSTMSKAFLFPLIIFLGTFLKMDNGLGYGRVLNTLPLPAKEIGRSLWLASVALPAIAIMLLGALALIIFSDHQAIHWADHMTNWLLIALVLGGAFGGLTFAHRTPPDNVFGRVKFFVLVTLSTLSLFAYVFIQLVPPTLLQSIFIFTALTALTVAGWFRAEKIMLPRAGFRPSASTTLKKFTPQNIPVGFGGLAYLMQKSFVLTTLIGLALMAWMISMMSFFSLSNGSNRAEAITTAIDGGMTPGIFVLLISIAPMVFQLRVLRTLPMAPSTLAATMVLVPVAAITTVGLIVTAVTTCMVGETIIPHTVNSFLMFDAKIAMLVSVIVWRGLDAVTYLIMFLMMVADSFISLGITMIFHLGTRNAENPVWIALVIFLVFAAVSVALTRMLLTQSSSPYRARTMPLNAWSMMRK